MKVILASKSPRRKELMDFLGIDYEIKVSEADETLEEGLAIEEQSKRLGYIKAKAVFDQTTGDRIVIGSDTLVVKDNKLFGKPKDKQDAINMLNKLKNTYHTVITSLCVLIEKNGQYKEYLDYDTTKVFFRDMTEEEILHWIEIGNPYNKSGSYELASPFCVFVDKIDGNITTVQGLPTHKLYNILKGEI